MSQAPKTPTPRGDESPEFVVMGEAVVFAAVGQAPGVVVVGYPHASSGLAKVA